jgi:hypothetical protein
MFAVGLLCVQAALGSSSLTARVTCTTVSDRLEEEKIRCALPHQQLDLTHVVKQRGTLVSVGFACDDSMPQPPATCAEGASEGCADQKFFALATYGSGVCPDTGEYVELNIADTTESIAQKAARAAEAGYSAMILVTTADMYVSPQLFALPVVVVRKREEEATLVAAGEEMSIHIKGLKGALTAGGRSASFESAGDVYYQGLRLYKLAQYKSAVPLLEEAAMMDPSFLPSHFSLADALFEQECTNPTMGSSCVHDGYNWLPDGLSPTLAAEIRTSLDELVHGNNNGHGNGRHALLNRSYPTYENRCKIGKEASKDEGAGTSGGAGCGITH